MNFFDLHCDTATVAMKKGAGLSRNGLQLDLAKLGEHRLCQSYAVFIPDHLRGDAAWQYFVRCHAYWQGQIAAADDMTLLQYPADAKESWQDGKNACFFAVEGGAVLAGEAEKVSAKTSWPAVSLRPAG